MKNKFKKCGVIAILIILVFTLASCTPSEDAFFKKLNDKLKKVTNHYEKIYDYFISTESFSYTIESEEVTVYNFDLINKVMPSEKKYFYRNFKYTYKKDKSNEYMKLTTNIQKIANNQPVYESDNKTPLYEINVQEGSIVNNELKFILDCETVYEGAIDEENPEVLNFLLYFNIGIDFLEVPEIDAVFSVESKRFFSTEISQIIQYNVVETSATLPYKTSVYASGHSEDLKFDWENITGVEYTNYTYTTKKNKPVTIEYYFEEIKSNYKKSNPIWSNEEVINWQGDRIKKGETIITFE